MKSHAKFNTDKTYKYFPGIAIIYFIKSHNYLSLISNIVDEMMASKLFNKYVFLPKNSYHMTVSDLLTYNDLKTNKTFNQFPLKNESDIKALDTYVYKQLQTDKYKLNVSMEVTKITARKIHLKPKTYEDKLVLDEFRKNIANRLNIPFDKDYQFHISLSYLVANKTEKDKHDIDYFLNKLNKKYVNQFNSLIVNTCDLSIFNDMAEFKNITYSRSSLQHQPS